MENRLPTEQVSNTKQHQPANEIKTWYDNMQPLVHLVLAPVTLAILTLALYLPSLHYPFQFDDIANIAKRFGIRFDNPWERWWSSTRWLGEWLNIVNYKIGGFDPASYRLLNIILHLTAGLLVFFLIRDLCRYASKESFSHRYANYLAFTTAGLFLVHPVQTQTVSYVIQARLEGLASLLVLGVLYSFVRMTLASSLGAKIALGSLTCVLALLSCGTKELVVVTPLLLILVDWFFLSEQNWELFKKRLWFHALFSTGFFLLMARYLGAKFMGDAVLGKISTGNNRGNILTPQPYDVITPFQYLISEFKVMLHYITMFFWPTGISVEYDWKIEQTIFSFQVIGPFLVLSGLFASAVAAIRSRAFGAFSFGLLWFFVAIAPRATIIPSPELVCDYKTYLSSLGILFILAYLLVGAVQLMVAKLRTNTYTYEASMGLLCLCLMPVTYAAYQRNLVWKTCVDFWEDNVKKAPNKARVHNNYGVALSEVGRFEESLAAYEKAISLDAYYSDPLSNKAVAHSMLGDTDKAIESLRGAIHLSPNYPEAYNNLGTLLLQKKEYEDAERALDFAIQLRPHYGKAYYNKARMYEEKNDHEKAWAYLKKATEGDLDLPEVFYKLGQMSMRVKKFDDAIKAFAYAINAGYSTADAHFNLANSYFMVGKHDIAQSIYEKLAVQNPLDGRFVYNLAEVLYTKEDYPRAMELFKRVTSLPNPVPNAFFRLVNCMEKLAQVEEAKSYIKDLLQLNAPDDFKTALKNELVRLDLQDKVTKGKGTISLTDFKQALAHQKTPTTAANLTNGVKKSAAPAA